MREPPALAEQFILIVLVCAATGALTGATGIQAWMLAAPCVVSVLWRIQRMPRLLEKLVQNAAYALLGLACVLGLILMAYPVLGERLSVTLALIAGLGLAIFAALFLFGTPVWPPEKTLLPVTLGIFVIASFNTAFVIYRMLALGGAAVIVWLAYRAWLAGGSRGLARRIVRTGASAAATGVLAWGIIVCLPWAQGHVEKATFGFFSPQESSYGSFSLQSRLGDLEELKVSSRVVMRVWSLRPQKLRGRVFTQFDGTSWLARAYPSANFAPLEDRAFAAAGSEGPEIANLSGVSLLAPGRAAQEVSSGNPVRTKIVQSLFNSGLLVAPGNVVAVRAPVTSLRMDSHGTLAAPVLPPVQIYGVVNLRESGVAEHDTPAAQTLAESLNLPPDTDYRFRELAAQLAAQGGRVEERIRRTVEHVQKACSYSLRVGKFRSAQPVAEFFFEKKRGYCQYFASAAAILLRLQGIPCRYVTGFNVAEYNYGAGHLVVREADAHAWLEVHVPGKGWVEADPTPDAEFAAARESLAGGWWTVVGEWLQAEFAEMTIRVREGDWSGLFQKLRELVAPLFSRTAKLLISLAAGLAVMAYYLRRWLGARKLGRLMQPFSEVPGATDPGLEKILEQTDELCARHGFARPASRAPLEHLRSIPEDRMPAAARSAAREAIDCYYGASFGRQALAAARLEEVLCQVATALRQASILR